MIQKTQQTGNANHEVIEASDDPHRLARQFLKTKFTTADSVLTLHFWRGEFLVWRSGAWHAMPREELKSQLTRSIKSEFDRLNLAAQKLGVGDKKDEWPPQAKKVTRSVVENTMLALQSLVVLDGQQEQPAWLTDACSDYQPKEMLVTQSGILHLPSIGTNRESLLPLTPNFFTPTSLDYDFDASAECPEWLKFLESVWPTDPESVALLQEFFGLLLTSDTRFHKMLLIIGPARSGKGTIGRIAKQLLGASNIASPTLGSLAEQFGLQSLLDKTMALVADARLSGRADAVAVVERLLSITGEDPQDVQRKHMPTLPGIRLKVRFVILANELPSLRDAAGALLSRVLLLKTTRSFVGHEDRGLEARLLKELPGILNWAIVGWQRLMARGKFEQPQTGQELIDDLEELSSPVSQFIRERCIVGPEFSVSAPDLFGEWKNWCEHNGREHPGTQQTFGRDIRAAQPNLSMKRTNRDGERERHYQGLALRRNGPQWSTDFSVARDAERPETDNSKESNGVGRGPSRTDGQATQPATPCDNPSSGAQRPRNARLDAPKHPPWITRRE